MPQDYYASHSALKLKIENGDYKGSDKLGGNLSNFINTRITNARNCGDSSPFMNVSAK